MEENKQKEINKFVEGNQKRILILLPIISIVFICSGFLLGMKDSGGFFMFVGGIVFLLAFIGNFLFRKKIIEKNENFFQKNNNSFIFWRDFKKASDRYIIISSAILGVVVLIILLMIYFDVRF